MKKKYYFFLIVLCASFSIVTTDDLNTLYRQAYLYVKNNELEKAYALYTMIYKQTPHKETIAYNLGYVCNVMGKRHEAIEWYTKTLEREYENEKAHLGLAKARLAIGDFQNGWPEFEYRMANYKTYIKRFHHQQLTPDDLVGKRVFLRVEWGFGDLIHFLRYAKLLKNIGVTVIVQTFNALMKLLSLCSYIDQLVPIGKKPQHYDIQIPYLSLPLIFGTKSDTIPAPIPYLSADEKIVELWRRKLNSDPHFKIGICWHAKPIYLEESPYTRRSIPLKLFAPLAEIENVSFYSLQKIDGVNELHGLPEHFVVHAFNEDFDESRGRFMDTAALIKNCDLIISADTSIVHIAGALGAQVWVLLPYTAEWRWQQKRTDCPWYPNNMRLFRQQQPGQWESVIEEVKHALQEIITKN